MKQKILSYLLVILFFALAHGKEFQVNNRTSLSQANVDVAAGPNGRFYTVWSSYFGTAGRSNDIICRIFEPNCAPTGDEFQINQTVLGNQTEPSIAVKKPTGDFIVVWQGPGLIEEDGEDIFAQWIDANGLPLGDGCAGLGGNRHGWLLSSQIHGMWADQDMVRCGMTRKALEPLGNAWLGCAAWMSARRPHCLGAKSRN